MADEVTINVPVPPCYRCGAEQRSLQIAIDKALLAKQPKVSSPATENGPSTIDEGS